MAIHSRAGQHTRQSDLINVAQLTAQYYSLKPQANQNAHRVKFGTSGFFTGRRQADTAKTGYAIKIGFSR